MCQALIASDGSSTISLMKLPPKVMPVACVLLCLAAWAVADTVPFPQFSNPNEISRPGSTLGNCDSFGQTVVPFDGRRFLVGCPGSAGAIFIYRDDGTQVLEIQPPNLNASSVGFGADLTKVGNFIAAGVGGLSRFDPSFISRVGTAFLFDTNGVPLVTYSNPVVVADSRFGSAIANVGTSRLAIGAPGANTDSGAVYLFHTNGTLMNTITNPVKNAGDTGFGTTIFPVTGSRFVVAGDKDHHAHLFSSSGTLLATFTDVFSRANGGYDNFGYAAMQFRTNGILISAPGYSATGAATPEGRVYHYLLDGTLVGIYDSPQSGSFFRMGRALAPLDNGAFMTTAQSLNELSDVVGALLMFEDDSDPAWIIHQPGHVDSLGSFGEALARVSTNLLVVGSPTIESWYGAVFLAEFSLTTPDAFEPDDTPGQARKVTTGKNLTHTLHRPDDEDWISFYGLSNFAYRVETRNVGNNADTALDVYFSTPAGALINLASNVNVIGIGGNDRYDLDQRPSGTYLVRIYHEKERNLSKSTRLETGEGYGDGAMYDVSVDGPALQLLAVIALDGLDPTGTQSPSGATVSIDGGPPQAFGGGNSLSFPGLSAGVHTISVSTASGYMSVEDPALPGQLANPTNVLYGNPRDVDVRVDQVTFALFAYLPFVTVGGAAVDAFTGAAVDGAPLAFDATSGVLLGQHITGAPFGTEYASTWITDNAGAFPEPLVLPQVNYDATLGGLGGYAALPLASAINGASRGQHIDLGTLTLTPLDINSNGVADVWEALHFGTNSATTADSDGDGLSDIEEYFAGTDPTNATSSFSFQPNAAPQSNGVMSVCWPVTVGRTYAVERTYDLIRTNWAAVFGPWMSSTTGVYCWEGTLSGTAGVFRVNVILP